MHERHALLIGAKAIRRFVSLDQGTWESSSGKAKYEKDGESK